MPILTKNETPAKGQKAEFQLDKAALALVTSVAADPYFSDSSNWHHVEMIFRSDVGNQRRIVKFDASQATPVANFFASAKSRDIFQIEKIIINDFDGDDFTVYRSELIVAEFDIDMTTSSYSPQWVKSRPSDLSDYQTNGLISNIGGTWNNGAYASTGVSGNFTVTMEISMLQTGYTAGDVMFGYLITPTSLIGGLGVSGNSAVSRTIYLDQGTSFSNYSGGFSNISGYFGFTIGIITLVMTRVGSSITFTLSQGVNTMTGTMETSNSNTIYPYFLPYSPYIRLNNISVTN